MRSIKKEPMVKDVERKWFLNSISGHTVIGDEIDHLGTGFIKWRKEQQLRRKESGVRSYPLAAAAGISGQKHLDYLIGGAHADDYSSFKFGDTSYRPDIVSSVKTKHRKHVVDFDIASAYPKQYHLDVNPSEHISPSFSLSGISVHPSPVDVTDDFERYLNSSRDPSVVKERLEKAKKFKRKMKDEMLKSIGSILQKQDKSDIIWDTSDPDVKPNESKSDNYLKGEIRKDYSVISYSKDTTLLKDREGPQPSFTFGVSDTPIMLKLSIKDMNDFHDFLNDVSVRIEDIGKKRERGRLLNIDREHMEYRIPLQMK